VNGIAGQRIDDHSDKCEFFAATACQGEGLPEILDERIDGNRVAIVVDGAERAIALLGREGIEHQIVNLNLDEIFEAYVAGRHGDSSAAAKPQAVVIQTAEAK
jgi:hypothetical protein